MDTAPTIALKIAAIGDWIRRCGRTYAAIAVEIGADEKSVRQAVQENWNPRATTLGKFETLLPPGWQVGDPVPADASEGASATASEGVSA